MKLTILANQQAQIKSSQEQLQQCQDSIEDKLRLSDKKAIVEQKDMLAHQIEQLKSHFSPKVIDPGAIADFKFLPAADFKFGTLSARELLPDASKCFKVDVSFGKYTKWKSVSVTVQAIDHLGDPCCLSEEIAPPLEFILSSEIKGKQLHEFCRISRSQYKIFCTPNVKGLHYLHALIIDCSIKGSPFTIGVSLSAEKLSNQISSIDIEKPWGVAVNSKRRILVTNSANNCVSVFNPGGEQLLSFGTLGSGEGQFNNPRGIAVDHNDNIAVVDYNNHRIQLFTAKGEFLNQVGPEGKGPLQFQAPTAIAFNSYNKMFYVIDKRQYSFVQILSPKFEFCGSLGTNHKEYGHPDSWCIGCDSSGHVYVTNSREINVFRAEGFLLKIISSPQVADPGGIAFDENNFMCISSNGGHNISVCNTEGKLIKKIGVHGKLENQFNRPRGVTFDHYGILYVCDVFNNRICMY